MLVNKCKTIPFERFLDPKNTRQPWSLMSILQSANPMPEFPPVTSTYLNIFVDSSNKIDPTLLFYAYMHLGNNALRAVIVYEQCAPCLVHTCNLP